MADVSISSDDTGQSSRDGDFGEEEKESFGRAILQDEPDGSTLTGLFAASFARESAPQHQQLGGRVAGSASAIPVETYGMARRQLLPANFSSLPRSGNVSFSREESGTGKLDGTTESYIARDTPKRLKQSSDPRRQEKNLREKARSFRINEQIADIKNLLIKGGVAVTRGTKAAVLSDAASYIRSLQQQQAQMEMYTGQLVNQVASTTGTSTASHPSTASLSSTLLLPSIPIPTLPTSAAAHPSAINQLEARTVAAGHSNMHNALPTPTSTQSNTIENANSTHNQTKINPDYFRLVLNHSSVPTAIAELGGTLLYANTLFMQLSGYTQQEIETMTIFSLVSRKDLQRAFESVSAIINGPSVELGELEFLQQLKDGGSRTHALGMLEVALKFDGRDLRMNIDGVRDENGSLKCISISLVGTTQVRPTGRAA